MIRFSTLTLCSCMALAACGDGTNPFDIDDVEGVDLTVEGVTTNDDGTYTVVDDGVAYELTASGVTLNGQVAWINDSERASSFITDDVTVIGGFVDDAPFSGITGTLAAAPTGDATYSGYYNYVTETANVDGALDLTFDLDTLALTSEDDADFVVAGAVATDGSITGTVAVDDVATDFSGGFYGDDAVAGAFDDETAAGVFYGTN